MKKPLLIIPAIILLALAVFLTIHFTSTKPIPTGPLPDTTQQPIAIADGRQCYTYFHDATDEEPVTSTEFIDMTITGTQVSGTKQGTQSGPELTNGWEGTITGTVAGDTMNVAFAYTVEGSKNTEHEIYQAGLTGIDKLRYPLIDKFRDGLFPDTTQAYTKLHYARVGCEGSH